MSSFLHRTTIRLHDTDAAGVLYFANQLRLAHEAFEAFLQSAGSPIQEILRGPYYLPVVHAEADFTAPLVVGDEITIKVNADRIGETSFTVLYHFLKNETRAVGSARTVHVAVDATSKKKQKLPDPLRDILKKIG